MPGGRPSKYDPEMCERARIVCEAGATDVEMCEVLGIGLTTFYRYKVEFQQFREAVTRAKEVADLMVEAALFRRATGYTFDAVKVVSVPMGANQGSEVQHIPYVEHLPPDPASMQFWLKNRQPDKWRDKGELQHTGDVGIRWLPVEKPGDA